MKITGEWLTNPSTQTVCQALEKAGYKALFVGGCVRNALLDVPVDDIDIATDAPPETVIEIEKAAGFKVIPTGVEHGTVTVVAEGIPHEITTFRHDVETDGRRAVVAYSDNVEDDARRRDFTMNALYADTTGTVIDPLGGLVDIVARRVRFIDSPSDRIREDYLRTLRFFRFHAWYGEPESGLDPEGMAAIAQHLEGLDRLSRERVGAEMKKLLAAPDPAPAVAAMRATGALTHVLPGSDDRALGPLVHLESLHGIDPDWLRRLAVIGGEDLNDRLRLSRKDADTLSLLRAGIESTDAPGRLGYFNGYERGRDILLLRAALFETPLTDESLSQVLTGSLAHFPLKAADLMPQLSGPALGQRLKALENLWIESRFSLSAKDLLSLPEDHAE